MTVLVTGGAGFVGLAIAEALLARGDRVVLLDRAPPPDPALRALERLPGELAWALADVRDEAAVDAAFAGHRPSRVVHAAAMTVGAAGEQADAAAAVAVNVQGTVAVTRAATAHGVTRMVFLSSGSVYGDNAYGEKPLDEAMTTPAPRSVYAVSKYAGERLALRLAELGGLSLVAARLSAVFGRWERDTGARQTLSPIYQVMRAMRSGAPVVLPRSGRRDWIYSRDVAGAVLALLDRREKGPALVNVGPGIEWTVGAWCERLTRLRPGFAYRIESAAETATIDYHGPGDRAPLAAARLFEEVGFRPVFGLDAAQDDYLTFLDELPDYGP